MAALVGLMVVGTSTGVAYLLKPQELRVAASRVGLQALVPFRCGGAESRSGYWFRVTCTQRAVLFAEDFVGTTREHEFAIATDAAVNDVERSLGRRFISPPMIYLFPSTIAYTDGVEAFGASSGAAANTGTHTSGVFLRSAGVILLNLEQIVSIQTDLRHELAHALIETAAPGKVPLWLHEGLAITAETDSDDWASTRRRFVVASMARSGTLPELRRLSDDGEWLAWLADGNWSHGYDYAAEVVSALRGVANDAIPLALTSLGAGGDLNSALVVSADIDLDDLDRELRSRARANGLNSPGVSSGVSGSEFILLFYGFTPGDDVTVEVLGSESDGEEQVTFDRDGTYLTSLGSTWAPGNYLIRVKQGRSITGVFRVNKPR
ncbi:MAG TPA: hypothetical protein VMO26_00945 [Vicinamibacterales bacterium]|nr:hypothetical protein [Vicinamibacterales bacterium]